MGISDDAKDLKLTTMTHLAICHLLDEDGENADRIMRMRGDENDIPVHFDLTRVQITRYLTWEKNLIKAKSMAAALEIICSQNPRETWQLGLVYYENLRCALVMSEQCAKAKHDVAKYATLFLKLSRKDSAAYDFLKVSCHCANNEKCLTYRVLRTLEEYSTRNKKQKSGKKHRKKR